MAMFTGGETEAGKGQMFKMCESPSSSLMTMGATVLNAWESEAV